MCCEHKWDTSRDLQFFGVSVDHSATPSSSDQHRKLTFVIIECFLFTGALSMGYSRSSVSTGLKIPEMEMLASASFATQKTYNDHHRPYK